MVREIYNSKLSIKLFQIFDQLIGIGRLILKYSIGKNTDTAKIIFPGMVNLSPGISRILVIGGNSHDNPFHVFIRKIVFHDLDILIKCT